MSEEVAREHLRRMRVTAACRFIASARLGGRDRRSALTIAIASSLVLSATIIPFIYRGDVYITNGLTLISFFTSLLIIAFSLIQYSTNDAARAEQFHRCALENNELCRLMDIHIASVTDQALEEYTKRYNTILQKYSINHDKADHDFFKTTKPDQYKVSWLERLRIGVSRWLVAALPFVLLALIPAAFLLLIMTDTGKSAEHAPPAKTDGSIH